MNKILVAALLAGFGAQLIKLIIYYFRHKALAFKDLIVTGGMPSSHAAFMVSLSTIIYLEEGTSTSFALSLILAIMVLRDSFGVRRAVGEGGLMLEKIVKKLKMKPGKKMHYSLGHTPGQVLIGSLFGVVVSICVHYLL